MEVSPECGERSPIGKSVRVSEVEKEDIEEPIPVLGDTAVVSVFGSLFRAAKRVAAAWCWRHNVQNGASGCSFRAAIATGSRVRPTERSNGQRSSSDREEMGCRSASLVVRCDIAGPIAAKQRKNERKQSNGYSVSIYRVSVGSSDTLEHSRALRLQGRRPLVPMCRSVGEAGDWGGGRDFAGDLFRRKKGCQGCGNSINACWEIGSDLVGSVGSGGRCRDSRWTGVDDKICTRPEAVETCCRLTAIREFALSKLL
ncbi:hypothetical protein BHM03_00061238 [Ensete ventricosum]|nr:hypothetical protein BHM03_00061238 [Ensete ventricosum]